MLKKSPGLGHIFELTKHDQQKGPYQPIMPPVNPFSFVDHLKNHGYAKYFDYKEPIAQTSSFSASQVQQFQFMLCNAMAQSKIAKFSVEFPVLSPPPVESIKVGTCFWYIDPTVLTRYPYMYQVVSITPSTGYASCEKILLAVPSAVERHRGSSDGDSSQHAAASASASAHAQSQAQSASSSRPAAASLQPNDAILGVVGHFDVVGTSEDFQRLMSHMLSPSNRPTTLRVARRLPAGGFGPSRLLKFGAGTLGVTFATRDGQIVVAHVDADACTAECQRVGSGGEPVKDERMLASAESNNSMLGRDCTDFLRLEVARIASLPILNSEAFRFFRANKVQFVDIVEPVFGVNFEEAFSAPFASAPTDAELPCVDISSECSPTGAEGGVDGEQERNEDDEECEMVQAAPPATPAPSRRGSGSAAAKGGDVVDCLSALSLAAATTTPAPKGKGTAWPALLTPSPQSGVGDKLGPKVPEVEISPQSVCITFVQSKRTIIEFHDEPDYADSDDEDNRDNIMELERIRAQDMDHNKENLYGPVQFSENGIF